MTTFTKITRQPVSWPATFAPADNYFLKIAESRYLLINDTKKLKIAPGSGNTAWTLQNRTGAS